jgi:hypothetical protein
MILIGLQKVTNKYQDVPARPHGKRTGDYLKEIFNQKWKNLLLLIW